ncbi:hypothetical protein H310_03609 [Aphanomyces invadans]|uniref:PCI domain-containing protein n=1 Tax=Aphanomyces invadans TaxID=157072 RepID=A0A024UII6_9STRA|nr:hypothetical protein H310_03609 [Aphanomyces invadans]ETW05990.1 hypothetical protein H310_03609 [Aphanomyces invadans]|eukprot:XP_008865767.1 hypothetical protein H310_03609 [Aphanomyces invadans]
MWGRQGGPHRCLELLLRQYLEESDGRSLLLRGTDAVGTFRCALIRNSQDDDPGIAHELYRGLPTTSYVAYLAQVLLAWKEMARNPLFQLPHVPMGGVTEDRSSLHRVLEVPVALVQSMDSVMALDSLITAIGGARGILTLLGVRCTIGSTLVCPPTRAQCLEAFRRPQSDGSKSSVLTVGARQWTKHIQRSLDGWWGVNKGSEAAKNAAAERKVVELLDTTVWMNVHGLPNGPVVFEIRQDQGYGARWSLQGADDVHFRGFVEPYIENGHAMGLEAFDLDVFASKYAGVNRIRHVMFIMDHGFNPQVVFEDDNKRDAATQLAKNALRFLLSNLEATKATTVNTTLYRELTTKFKEFLPMDYHPDATFLENAVRANASRHERLEQELNSYKCSMIKESIRIGHNDLGEFYYRTGDLANSLRSYIQARDYCTTEKHIVDMCFNVIKASIHLKNYSNAYNYLVKLEQSIGGTSIGESDPTVQAQTAATFGLVHFCSKKYHAAALKFVECQVDIGDKYNEVIHAEDVAVLGGLCAVATFSRAELKEHVVQNSSFKAYLELVPRLREFITAFYDGNYASSLNILADLTDELALDMYVAPHVVDLVKEIRHRAIAQYFHPYLSVDLNVMAVAFNTPVGVLEVELGELIVANKLQARIDSHNQVLYAFQPDQRAVTFKKALEMGRQYTADTKSLILRMNLVKHGIAVGSKYGAKDSQHHQHVDED